MPLDRDPICPHCEAVWEDGPSARDFGGHYDVIYCPTCAKVVAVLPVKQTVRVENP